MDYRDCLLTIQSKLWKICLIKKNEKYQTRDCHKALLYNIRRCIVT